MSSTRLAATFKFPFAVWLASRLLVLVGLLLAPHWLVLHVGHNLMGTTHPAATGWSAFANWDAGWYLSVVSGGYDYAADGAQHNVAFFPLYPLLVGGVMRAIGLSFEQAGVLVSNVAFLGAVLLFYDHVRRQYGEAIARWAAAALAFFPYAFFGSVVYADGLLLFTIVGALWSFSNRRYVSTALFGACATATKILAAPLIPAFLWVCWRERRPAQAWVASLAMGLGLLAYVAYCAWRFGDPLAFVHVQQAWRGNQASGLVNWVVYLLFAPLGLLDLREGGYAGMMRADAAKLVCFAGGSLLFFLRRAHLRPPDFWFGAGVIALVLLAGPLSAERYVMSMAPLYIALGGVLVERPRRGLLLLGYFACLLVAASFGFAYRLWLA